MPFSPQQNKQCSDLAKPTKPQQRSAANSPSSETSLSQQSQGHELRAHRRSLERTMSLQDESGELRKPSRSPEPGLSSGSQGKSSVRTWNTLIMEERVKERSNRKANLPVLTIGKRREQARFIFDMSLSHFTERLPSQSIRAPMPMPAHQAFPATLRSLPLPTDPRSSDLPQDPTVSPSSVLFPQHCSDLSLHDN